MAVTVLRKTRTTPPDVRDTEIEPIDWLKVATSGSLICGGLLLLTGKKRAGLIAAATGTALAILDQGDSIRHWWETLPQYLGQAHSVIDRAQEMVDKVADKGQSLRRILKQV